MPSRKDNGVQAILTRTNLALFLNAMKLRSKGKAFHFERDIQHVLFRALDVYWLSRGQKDRIRDVFIGSFGSFEQVVEGQLERIMKDLRNIPVA